jgi:hypothetical protein
MSYEFREISVRHATKVKMYPKKGGKHSQMYAVLNGLTPR